MVLKLVANPSADRILDNNCLEGAFVTWFVDLAVARNVYARPNNAHCPEDWGS